MHRAPRTTHVAVTPRQGSVLSFQNVDEHGAPHKNGKHLVSAVPKEATQDRIVVQIPIAHKAGQRPYAYPEHEPQPQRPPVFFVTNNSTKSRAGYLKKFTSLGLSVQPEEIFSSSFAAAACARASRASAQATAQRRRWRAVLRAAGAVAICVAFVAAELRAPWRR